MSFAIKICKMKSINSVRASVEFSKSYANFMRRISVELIFLLSGRSLWLIGIL